LLFNITYTSPFFAALKDEFLIQNLKLFYRLEKNTLLKYLAILIPNPRANFIIVLPFISKDAKSRKQAKSLRLEVEVKGYYGKRWKLIYRG